MHLLLKRKNYKNKPKVQISLLTEKEREKLAVGDSIPIWLTSPISDPSTSIPFLPNLFSDRWKSICFIFFLFCSSQKFRNPNSLCLPRFLFLIGNWNIFCQSMEAIEELVQLSDSIRQAASVLADEDVDETTPSRRPSTFLNIVALGNVVSFYLVPLYICSYACVSQCGRRRFLDPAVARQCSLLGLGICFLNDDSRYENQKHYHNFGSCIWWGEGSNAWK